MIHPFEAFSNFGWHRAKRICALPSDLSPRKRWKAPQNRDELFDASGSVELSKKLKEAGIKCANSADLGMEIPTLERRSSELWLGLILIIDKLAIPVNCRSHFQSALL